MTKATERLLTSSPSLATPWSLAYCTSPCERNKIVPPEHCSQFIPTIK